MRQPLLPLLLFFFLWLPLSAAEPPPGYQLFPFPGWDWAAQRPASGPGEPFKERIEEVLHRLRGFLGVERQGRPLIIRAPDKAGLQAVLDYYGRGPAEEWATAVALPSRGVVILDATYLATHPLSGAVTVSHELAHVVLHEAGGDLPRWYHEGLAQWLAGQRLTPRTQHLISVLSHTGGTVPFRELDQFLPMRHFEADLLYGQCLSFVRFLSHEWGNEVHRDLLLKTQGELGFLEAFRGATGTDLDEAEARWRSTLPFATGLIALIVDEGLSWRGLAFLVLVAFITQKILRRRALNRMRLEEEAEDQGISPP